MKSNKKHQVDNKFKANYFTFGTIINIYKLLICFAQAQAWKVDQFQPIWLIAHQTTSQIKGQFDVYIGELASSSEPRNMLRKY